MPSPTPTDAASALKGITSMATRGLLAELVALYEAHAGRAVTLEAVGGVDAAKRVQAGEAFDVAFLAGDAIDKLISNGAVRPGSRVDLVRSPVAVAVREGAAAPDVSSEAALRQAVEAARTIGFSTGPSGAHLVRLFERWGLAGTLGPRTVQAPPGVPVGALVARGEVELGFQQLSELMHLPGIRVLGLLPGSTTFITTFSAGVPAASTRSDEVIALLDFFNAPDAVVVKRRHGMEPA
jgi:molybdate transport system substrate-binding protein